MRYIWGIYNIYQTPSFYLRTLTLRYVPPPSLPRTSYVTCSLPPPSPEFYVTCSLPHPSPELVLESLKLQFRNLKFFYS